MQFPNNSRQVAMPLKSIQVFNIPEIALKIKT